MAFPVSPTNGQVAVVNGVSYVYSTTKQAWNRLAANNLGPLGNLSVTNTITAGTVSAGTASAGTVSATNVNATTITASGFFYANGAQVSNAAYSNVTVAEYLPIYSGNILVANVNYPSASGNPGLYVTGGAALTYDGVNNWTSSQSIGASANLNIGGNATINNYLQIGSINTSLANWGNAFPGSSPTGVIGIGTQTSIAGSSNNLWVQQNIVGYGGAFSRYQSASNAGQYLITGNSHVWNSYPAGTQGSLLTAYTPITMSYNWGSAQGYGNLWLSNSTLTSTHGNVIATGFYGNLIGNATTATKFYNPAAINGLTFDGSANITIQIDGNLLIGTTLSSNVLYSNVVTVGNLLSLTSAGNITAPALFLNSNIVGSANYGAITYGNLTFTDSSIFGSFTANNNNYSQLVLQNSNSGTSASADYIVTNNLGTASAYYGDLGINSSNFTGAGSLSAPNAVYLYSASSDLVLGTYNSSYLRFVVANGATDAITVNPSGAVAFNGQYGSSNQALLSAGSSAPPVWTTVGVPSVSATWTGTQSFAGSATGFAASLTNVVEAGNVIVGAPGSVATCYFSTGAIQYYTANATVNWTQNITFSPSTTLNTVMSVGQVASVALLVTQGSSAFYPSTIQIDGTTVSPYWQGGTAPSSGNTNGIDSYTFSIIKTGNSAFTVLASLTKF